jgi:prephenate dehydrogenase
MRISVIGLGLIGGSMATDLKKTGVATHIIGVDNNEAYAEVALERGFIDEISLLDEAIPASDLIILAIPAQSTVQMLPQILDKVSNQVVIDVSSVKREVCNSVLNHLNRKNFVGTHPMAGTEYSGPTAAETGLFQDKVVVLTEVEKSSESALQVTTKVYEALGMRIRQMTAEEHDMHVAYVSHISHVSSMALASTVLEQEASKTNIFDLASGGFESTVRLAKSSPEMWAPIFIQNSDNILIVLDNYLKQIMAYKNAIETRNETEILQLINDANRIKKIVN